jgi:hypothetical protein
LHRIRENEFDAHAIQTGEAGFDSSFAGTKESRSGIATSVPINGSSKEGSVMKFTQSSMPTVASAAVNPSPPSHRSQKQVSHCRARRVSWIPGYGFFVLGFYVVILSVRGQLLVPPGQPTDGFVDVFRGWDFASMTFEELYSANAILNPEPIAERDRSAMTPEQRASEERAILAITAPLEYARRYPVVLSPEQMAEGAHALWSILNPVESAALARAGKTREQLEEEELWDWMMTYPADATALLTPLKTPEDLAREQQAAEEVTHPSKPDAIIERIPADPNQN